MSMSYHNPDSMEGLTLVNLESVPLSKRRSDALREATQLLKGRDDPELRAPLDALEQKSASHYEANNLRDLSADDRKALLALENALGSIDDYSPVLLKGIIMSHCYYEHPHLRPMDDIDLVIQADSVESVQSRLMAQGFELPNSSFGNMVMNQFIMTGKRPGGSTIAIDIHTRLFNRPGMNDLLSYDEILSSARQIMIADQTALAPSTEHCLIHAALHLMAHHQNSRKLIWLYDIWLLIQSLEKEETERLLAYSSRKRIALILVCALERCHQFFPLANLELLNQLKEQVEQQKNIEHPSTIALTDSGLTDRLKSDWKALSGFKTRLKWLKGHLFPSYSYISKKYNVSAFPLVWACYVWRIIHGSVKLFGIGS